MNKKLKKILGPCYGGPSISFEEGKFVIYKWYDAPVSSPILVKGKTIQEVVDKYLRKVAK